ncbi:MAG: hypothetical protein C4B56_04085 [Candidatus Methanophagaceae archaeon]|nr:MAG: hypothetical protein C4B56_04085 [Methanophagales archaeon]
MAEEDAKVLIVLTPSESKRLIAKAVRKLEEVERALEHGTIIIGLGTTNAYVAEELLNALRDKDEAVAKIEKERFAAGVITARGTCIVPKEERGKELIIREGRISDVPLDEALEELRADDVFIKGANALDVNGTAGILMANPAGGTIGSAIGTVMARGVNFIIPVGIEKTIPYPVTEAAKRVGIGRFYKSVGKPVGLMPVYGKVITEIEALKILGASNAFPMGAGGVEGGEGSAVICAEGSAEQMDRLMQIITQIKGEPALKLVKYE